MMVTMPRANVGDKLLDAVFDRIVRDDFPKGSLRDPILRVLENNASHIYGRIYTFQETWQGRVWVVGFGVKSAWIQRINFGEIDVRRTVKP